MYSKDSLISLFRQKALKFGQFTLASGKQASYYLDGKQVTLDAEGARLVADGILDLLVAAGPLPAAVGGMSIGADPITASVVTMSAALVKCPAPACSGSQPSAPKGRAAARQARLKRRRSSPSLPR